MRELRIAVGVLGVLVFVILVGGAALWVQLDETSQDTADLTCSLGTAISSSPISKRTDETDQDFAERVRILRKFGRDLRELDDCDPEHPIRVRINPENRDDLDRGREERPREGGDATGPPSGGGGLPGGGQPPSSPSVTDTVDETVNETAEAVDGATDTACDLTQDPDPLC